MQKRAWRKERENEESKRLVRELERVERREKKKQLEEKWSMMKWVTKFIEENEGEWKRERERKESGERRVTLADIPGECSMSKQNHNLTSIDEILDPLENDENELEIMIKSPKLILKRYKQQELNGFKIKWHQSPDKFEH